MPNHVANVIKMEGIANEPLYDYYKDINSNNEKYFDFNKIIPMPDTLDIICDHVMQDLAVYMAMNKFNNGNTIPVSFMDLYLNKNMTKERFEKDRNIYKNLTDKFLIDLGLKIINNKVLYGYKDWYGWSCDNWGTKWNSYDNEEISKDEIAFNTAWSEPNPILIQLSKMYPQLSIQHWWAEEFCGSGNSGHRLYKNGIVYGGYDEPMSYDSYIHYLFCWGQLDGYHPYEGNAIYNLGEGNAIYKLNENGNSIFCLGGNIEISTAMQELMDKFIDI